MILIQLSVWVEILYFFKDYLIINLLANDNLEYKGMITTLILFYYLLIFYFFIFF